MTTEKREGFRGTGFYKFNISDYIGKDKVLSQLFGEQTFTGVYSSQRFASFTRNFNLYNWDAETYNGTYNSPASPGYRSWWGSHYIGNSLLGVANFNDIPASAIQGAPPSRPRAPRATPLSSIHGIMTLKSGPGPSPTLPPTAG